MYKTISFYFPFFSSPVRVDGYLAFKALAIVLQVLLAYVFIIDYYVILHFLDALDRQAMIALNFFGSADTDRFWYAYSQKKLWAPLCVVALLSVYRCQPSSFRRRLLLVLVTIALVAVMDQLSSGLIKPLTERLRPSHTPVLSSALHYVGTYRGGMFGFVSGHATCSMGIAVWLALIFRDRLTRLSLMLFTLLMCYSRIYLGVHYPGDVICGAILGFVVAYTSFRFLYSRGLVSVSCQRPHALLVTYFLTLFSIIIYAV